MLICLEPDVRVPPESCPLMKDASSEMDQLVSYISKGIPEFIIDGLWACRSLEFRAEWEDNTIELISCLFLSILKVDLVTILVFIICGLQTTQAYRSLDFRVELALDGFGNISFQFKVIQCSLFANIYQTPFME